MRNLSRVDSLEGSTPRSILTCGIQAFQGSGSSGVSFAHKCRGCRTPDLCGAAPQHADQALKLLALCHVLSEEPASTETSTQLCEGWSSALSLNSGQFWRPAPSAVAPEGRGQSVRLRSLTAKTNSSPAAPMSLSCSASVRATASAAVMGWAFAALLAKSHPR